MLIGYNYCNSKYSDYYIDDMFSMGNESIRGFQCCGLGPRFDPTCI